MIFVLLIYIFLTYTKKLGFTFILMNDMTDITKNDMYYLRVMLINTLAFYLANTKIVDLININNSL